MLNFKMMAENKTKPTDVSPQNYLESFEDNPKTREARALVDLITAITKVPPTMWGTGIIGFGVHEYTYETGRSGRTPAIGVALRAKAFALYGLHQALEDNQELAPQLGRHKMGKGCVYFD